MYTKYGKRNVSLVHADVIDYFEWFGVDGVFVDEVSSSAADAPYYASLADFIRAQPPPPAARGAAKIGGGGGSAPLVVLNPGTNIDSAFEPSFDIVMSFEDTLAAYLDFEPAPWMRNASTLAPTRVWHCVHTSGGPPSNATGPLAAAVQRAKTLNAGRLYVTNETLPNPYADLPQELYWEDLIRWATNEY